MAVVLSCRTATLKKILLTDTCRHVCYSDDRKEDTYDYIQDRSSKRYDNLGSLVAFYIKRFPTDNE